MRHRLSCKGARKHRKPWITSFSAPFLHKRQGIDLTSTACEIHTTRRMWVGTSKWRHVRVLAAPMHAFRMQIIPLETTLSHSQLMSVLHARGLLQDDMAVDLLVAPEDQGVVAVFTLPRAQCEAWTTLYGSATTSIAAIEPDVHALWRYAWHRHATQHGWLMVMPHQSTLYWPAPWPWGYHAELLSTPSVESDDADHVLYTALRRACLMTGSDLPDHVSLRLTGDPHGCQRWQAAVEDIHWHYSSGPHPIAAGASLKSRRRWA